MAIGDNEGIISCYTEHMSKNNTQKVIKAHDDYILKVQLSPSNKYLASCSADKKIKLFKVNMDAGKF
jgi:WD40 repeat protein